MLINEVIFFGIMHIIYFLFNYFQFLYKLFVI